MGVLAKTGEKAKDRHPPLQKLYKNACPLTEDGGGNVKKPYMKKAWLVTWESPRTPPDSEAQIVAILDYRCSEKKVKLYIEQCYIDRCYSLEEKMACAKSRKNNPYPAEFNKINGLVFAGQITCGANPWLFGRLVKNLSLRVDEDGGQKLLWEETEIPKSLRP